MTNLSFSKEERLKSRKTLARLFKEGHSFSGYPIRVVWLAVEEENQPVTIQFTVSVPKKKFKLAVDRNRIKRQIREAYRLNKASLLEKLAAEAVGKTFAVMMIYVSHEKEAYAKIEKGVKKSLDRLGRELLK